MNYYKKNNVFNKPQFVLQHSGIFENDKQTVVIFLDEPLRTDARRSNVVDMFQPLIILDLNDTSKNSSAKRFFNNLNILLSAYTPFYNVILCSDDISLLRELMFKGFGKNEALLTGVTYAIDMQKDWKNKRGLFLDIKPKEKEVISWDDVLEDHRKIKDITCNEDMTNEELTC